MFGRNKDRADEAVEDHPHIEGAKNRPTPKRRVQEAKNRRPLVASDRKRAKEIDRQQRREQANLTRQAMMTGDDRHLPPRDKGPVKRFIRDYVDARWSIGEFLLPVMVVVLLLSFVKIPAVATAIFIAVYGMALIGIFDAVVTWRKIKAQLIEKLGPDAELKGGAMYAAMRMFQIRRTRMPRPQVSRGEFPS